MTNELKQKILKEISVLEIGECCGIEIGNGKGLFIQVDISIDDNFNRIVEYFIELNDIDEEYNYEPCGKYNEHSEYKNFDLLIETIDNYLKYHGLKM